MEDFIKKILSEPKILQWKVNQLQSCARSIYDAMGALLPSDAVAEKLGMEIVEYREALSKITERLKDYAQQEQERERIETEYQKYLLKLDHLQALREKHQLLNKLNEVLDEINSLSTINTEMLDQHVRTLETALKVFDTIEIPLETQLSGLAFILKSNLEKIKADHFNALNQIPLPQLKTKFDRLALEITAKIQEFNTYAIKIAVIKSDLDLVAVDCTQIIKSFETHHLQNEHVYGALTSREGPKIYIENLSAEIIERLRTYDAELRTLVANRDVLPVYELKEMNKNI